MFLYGDIILLCWNMNAARSIEEKQYLSGGDIYPLFQKSILIPPQQIASIMNDIISAIYFLYHMHPKIIHRDTHLKMNY